MSIEESAGLSVDQTTWSQILINSDDKVSHLLWVSVIQSVAKSVVTKTTNSIETSQDDIDQKATDLIETWLEDSMPFNDDLAYVLGDLVYFSDIDLAWDEKLNFSGEPCVYCEEVVSELREKLEYYPDAREAITDAAIQSFYTFWRSRFFKRVSKEARNHNT